MKISSRLAAFFLAFGTILSIAGAADRRSYSRGLYYLEIDGVGGAFVSGVSGGNAVGEVADESAGGTVVHKHISGFHIEPISVEVTSGNFSRWISDFLSGERTSHSGKLSSLDTSLKVVSQQSFNNATITEVRFPRLDISAKEAGKVEITFAVTDIRNEEGGQDLKSQVESSKQKQFQTSNFRIKIGELDCTRVAAIDGIEIRQPVIFERGQSSSAGKLSCSNLVLTVSESGIKPFMTYLEEFVVKGKSDASNEKNITLELLSPNLKDVIRTLDGTGAGIVTVRPISSDGDQPRRFEVEFYVEQWSMPADKGAKTSDSTDGTEKKKQRVRKPG